MTDIPGDLSTTATISVGGTVSNVLEVKGDHDWFILNLTAGQAVDVTLTGITLADPYLNIRDSGGTILYSNDDIIDGVNRNSEIKFNPAYTGTYYVDAGAFNDAYAGTYQLSVQPYTSPPLATNDQIAKQLTSGYWGGDVHHWAVTQGGTLTVNISTLNASEQTLALAALQDWTDIIGVKFQQVASGGQIVFDDSEGTSGSVASTDATWSNGIISSAHVQISTSWVTTYGTSIDSYSFQTYIHEIGHALGLGHAGNYNDTATYPYDALFLNDSWSTSIMSYFDQHENTYFGNQGFSKLYVLTPMVADIIAVGNLYGLSTTTRTGNTVYGYHSTAGGIYDATLYPKAAYTIFDSGGNDTIDYSGSSANQLINLNPETFSNVNGYTGNLEIARGVVIENAIGGSGNDTIIGNSADNVITGGLGSDTLTGGGGNDTFLDTMAGHNTDTITDFQAGDKIVFSDASLNSFTYSYSGSTLTYSGGSMQVGAGLRGIFVASAAASGGVQLVLRPTITHNDFNGDGRSDVLWRNDNGTLTDWLANANGSFTQNGAATTGAADNSWHVVGTGDFNGDGRVDILWRNDSGLITDWLGNANGTFTPNSAATNGSAGTSWQVVGTGDFNGDGRSDILWRNSSGLLTEWTANADGSFTPNSAATNGSAGSTWHVVGTGDFNGDGYDDILWRNDSGLITEWTGSANGTFTPNNAATNGSADTSWQVVGTGDFNGDGIADILWRNSSGLLTEWLGNSNGTFSPNSAATNGSADPSWHVASIGDFNGDGRSDILWRNDSGYVTEWLSNANGSFTPNSVATSGAADISWHVQDPFFHDPF